MIYPKLSCHTHLTIVVDEVDKVFSLNALSPFLFGVCRTWANRMQYAFCTSCNLNIFCSKFIFVFWEDNFSESLWSSSTIDIFVLRHEQELDMLTNSFDPFWMSWTCREGDQVSVLTPLARVTSVRPFSCENTAAKEHAKHKRAPWTHLPLLYVYLHGQPGIWISFQGMKYWWDSSLLSGRDF